MYIQPKNKLWNSCYLCHLCVLSYCFSFSFYYCFSCICSSVLESQSDVWKSAFRSWDIFGSLWVFPNGLDLSLFTALDGPTKQRSCPLYWEKVGSRYGGALFFFHTFVLGTNICFENILPSSNSFSIAISTEKTSKSILQLFYNFVVRCWYIVTFLLTSNIIIVKI